MLQATSVALKQVLCLLCLLPLLACTKQSAKLGAQGAACRDDSACRSDLRCLRETCVSREGLHVVVSPAEVSVPPGARVFPMIAATHEHFMQPFDVEISSGGALVDGTVAVGSE